MLKLLVIKDKDYALPKGHITQVLTGAPSEYELSKDSPWRLVEVPSLPVPAIDETLVVDGNDLKRKKIKDHIVHRKDIKKRHPHPPGLVKASIVWDYGPGRTYSTPQSAFDACQLFWGMTPIDSNQYIRGWSGTYVDRIVGTPHCVLQIKGLLTNGAGGHYLIIDANEGEEVIFAIGNSIANSFGICGGNASISEQPCHDVIIRGIRIEAGSLTIGGIASSYAATSAGSQRVENWSIEDCDIIAKANLFTASYCAAITMAGVRHGQVHRCRITPDVEGYNHFMRYGVTDCATNWSLASPSNYAAGLIVTNCLIRAGHYPVLLNSNNNLSDPATRYLQLVHNTLESGSQLSGVYKKDAVSILISALNNLAILGAGGTVFNGPNTDITSLFGALDGNLYWGGNYARDKNQYWSMEYFQNSIRQELHSKFYDDPVNPLGLEAYIPLPSSPAVGLGVIPGYTDIEGNLLSRGAVDAGAYQVTEVSSYNPGTCGYCAIADVKDSTGVTYEDLELASEQDLDSLLCEWIKDVSSIIDRYCETSWDIGLQPPAIRRVATTMMADLVALAVQRRKSPFITLNNFSVKMVQDDLLTEDNKEVLLQYKKPEATLGKQYLGFGSGPVDSEDEDA